jgi:hypothetical protein
LRQRFRITITLLISTLALRASLAKSCSTIPEEIEPLTEAGYEAYRERQLTHPTYTEWDKAEFDKIIAAHFAKQIWIMKITKAKTGDVYSAGIDSYNVELEKSIVGEGPKLITEIRLERKETKEFGSDCKYFTEFNYHEKGKKIGLLFPGEPKFRHQIGPLLSVDGFTYFDMKMRDGGIRPQYLRMTGFIHALNKKDITGELSTAVKFYAAKKFQMVVNNLTRISSQAFNDVQRLELLALAFQKLGEISPAIGSIELADYLAAEFERRRSPDFDRVLQTRVLYNLAALQAGCRACKKQVANNLIRFARSLTPRGLSEERAKYFKILKKDKDFDGFRATEAYKKALGMLGKS